MNRERKVLLASIMLAIAGWVTATVLATSVGALKLQAASAEAEADAENWKRQAGKAYTEMLAAKAGSSAKTTAVLIPAGARIDCTMNMQVVDGHTVSKCEGGTIYPPRDY